MNDNPCLYVGILLVLKFYECIILLFFLILKLQFCKTFLAGRNENEKEIRVSSISQQVIFVILLISSNKQKMSVDINIDTVKLVLSSHRWETQKVTS